MHSGLPYDELHLSLNKTVLFPKADEDSGESVKTNIESLFKTE